MTTDIRQVMMMRDPRLIRYSNIKAELVKNEGAKAGAALEQEVEEAGRTCDTHGYLEDPVIFVDVGVPGNRVVVACPFCSSPEILAQWEAQG